MRELAIIYILIIINDCRFAYYYIIALAAYLILYVAFFQTFLGDDDGCCSYVQGARRRFHASYIISHHIIFPGADFNLGKLRKPNLK